MKVKVGPITAQYKGTAKLAEVDEAHRRIVIDASGRDTRGQGNAKAKIVVTMAEDGGGTLVDVATDLSITGKVAQFGRGVLADVSSKLMGQFVENLERDVLSGIDAGSAARRRASAERARRREVDRRAAPPDRVRARRTRRPPRRRRRAAAEARRPRRSSASWCCSCSGACSGGDVGTRAHGSATS